MSKAIFNKQYYCPRVFDDGICSLCTRKNTCSAYLSVKRRQAYRALSFNGAKPEGAALNVALLREATGGAIESIYPKVTPHQGYLQHPVSKELIAA